MPTICRKIPYTCFVLHQKQKRFGGIFRSVDGLLNVPARNQTAFRRVNDLSIGGCTDVYIHTFPSVYRHNLKEILVDNCTLKIYLPF